MTEPIDAAGRHAGTQQLARWLTPNPNLPDGLPAGVADVIRDVAGVMIHALPDGPELTAGLRKLLEARDCFVRAAIEVATPPGRAEPRRPLQVDLTRPVRRPAAAPVRRTPAPPETARPVEGDSRVRRVDRRQ